jgi:hypothetical protein
MVGNIDLAPTILDATNAKPGRVQDGTSVFGLLKDPTKEPGRELVIENGQGVNSVPQFRALRNERFLYVRHDTTGELELYDLKRDPFQLRNLEDADRYAGLRLRLASRLSRLQRCVGRACSSFSRPSVRLSLRQVPPRGRSRARSDAKCVSSDVRLSLFGRDGRQVESVRYTVGKRRIGTSRRRPFTVRVKRSRLPSGRQLKMRARVTTRDGRVITVDRRVTTCPRG